MFILTDPQRTPDPIALAEQMPRGAGLIYRTFGAPDAKQIGMALGRISRRRGLTLLITADSASALACGADGVHLPERRLAEAPRLRARWPGALITAATHSGFVLRKAAYAGVDAALLSTVFASLSPSARIPIGPARLSGLVRSVSLPVYALGGVDVSTAPRLRGTGIAGVAAVGVAVQALAALRDQASAKPASIAQMELAYLAS